MKKIILAALLLTSVSSVVLANGSVATNVIVNSGDGRHISASQVPAPVMATFNNMFPTATNVQWQVEKEHGSKVYQAEFTQNGKRWKAQFAPDGTFLGKTRA